jgi:hypothetical protein
MSTRVRKKEILSDDFKKRKILWKNIAENFRTGKFSMEHFPPHITNSNSLQQTQTLLRKIMLEKVMSSQTTRAL